MANWNMPPRDNTWDIYIYRWAEWMLWQEKLVSQSERPIHTAMEPTLMLFPQAGKTGRCCKIERCTNCTSCLNGRCFDDHCQIVTSILLNQSQLSLPTNQLSKGHRCFMCTHLGPLQSTPQTTSKHTMITSCFEWPHSSWRYFHSNELVTPCSLMSTAEHLQ